MPKVLNHFAERLFRYLPRTERVAAMLLFIACTCLPAQQTVTEATLSGRVLDPAGATVAGALVTAKNADTARVSTTRTDADGRFRFAFLPAGEYLVTAAVAGFSPASRQVQLSVGSAFQISLSLGLPRTTFQVSVTAAPPLIEANRSQISNTVMRGEIQNLPLEGRNYLNLALLTPGVSPANTGSVQKLAETSEVVGQGYSINGQRNFANSFLIDGLSANDSAAGVAGDVLGLDVVREFQVVSSGGQAEFGRSLGGYVNILTRSGTNQFHGDVFGYLRNQRLNASNALSRSRLPLTEGIYGASLSGPVQKNKTFLFGNFEEGRQNTDGIITIDPSDAAAINQHLAASGYLAPPLEVSNAPTTLYPTTLHTDTLFARLDRSLDDMDQFHLRYNFYKLSSLNARGVGGLAAVSFGTSVFDTNHTLAFGNVWTVSQRTFNETRGQIQYDDLSAPPVDSIGPTVTISGVAQFGRSSTSPTGRRNYLYELVDNLVMDRGAHSLKAGADFLLNNNRIVFPMSLEGAYTFSSLANFLAGTYNIQGFRQNFGSPAVGQLNPNIGVYFQDEWKAAPSFTLNAGLRYDAEFLETLHTDASDLAPRLGFAWSALPGRMVVRGGYGLFFGVIPLRPLANALLSARNTTDPFRAALLGYTYSPGDPAAPAFPGIAATPPSGTPVDFSVMNHGARTPYAQQANLGIEGRIAPSATVSASYQYSRGLHLIGAVNSNIAPAGTPLNPAIGNVRNYDSLFDSYFNGLEASLEQRAGAWGSARLSYTWSKAIDDVGSFFFSSPVNNFDPGQDRGLSNDDHRHRLVVDATMHVPFRLKSAWADVLARGWRLTGFLQYASAPPFNIVTGTTSRQGTPLRPCTPGYTLGENGGVNPCTEALKGAVVGRNLGRGFDDFDLDVRLDRTFAIDSRMRLSVFVEAFNALNRRNNLLPNGVWGTGPYPTSPNPSFGHPTAVADPRSIQLATRLSF